MRDFKRFVSALLAAGLVMSSPLSSLASDTEKVPAPTSSVEQSIPTKKPKEKSVTITENSSTERLYDAPVSGQGTWQQKNGKYWFKMLDGSYPYNCMGIIDGVVYAFDKDGWMVTGWWSDGKNWYYFGPSGARKYGWQYIGKTWYYFHPTYGYMFDSRYGYKGLISINSQYYAFKDSGAMVTGWWTDGEDWYYFNSSGVQEIGWIKVKNKWYYIWDNYGYGPNAYIARDGVYNLGNTFYAFDQDGAMVTGWYLYQTIDQDGSIFKEWMHFNEDGSPTSGWLYSGGYWYYLVLGLMQHDNILAIKGTNYGFRTDGTMATGWYLYSGNYYYFNTDGSARTGWVAYGKNANGETNWYYIQNGLMLANSNFTINGKDYHFDANGICTNPNI